MHGVNQITGYIDDDKELDCEIVREHKIPEWEIEDYEAFIAQIKNALKCYKRHNEADYIEMPKIKEVSFKHPKKEYKYKDNPVKKLLVTEKEIDDNYDVVKIVQEYTIEKGSEFFCSEKKANCTIEGFEPFVPKNFDINIIVRYENNEKGTSHIHLLSPI